MTKSRSNLVRAFARLRRLGIAAEHEHICCKSCGHAQMLDLAEDMRGYVFYESDDVNYAIAEGHLFIGFGGTNDSAESVAATACNVFGLSTLAAAWNGFEDDHIVINLKRKDIEFLTLIRDKRQEEVNMELAQEHHNRMLLFGWRRAAFRARVAKRKIRPHLMHWALKPGGPLCKKSARHFSAQLTPRRLFH